MEINILTIFPEMFDALNISILGRAQESSILRMNVYDIRSFSKSKHHNTDDYPYGGGAGMLMMVQPIADAMKAVAPAPYQGKRIFLGPRGIPLTQDLARELSKEPSLTLLCGHYEGVDERVMDAYIDMQISLGDYVLTGGELPAMVLIDCVSRMLKDVLGNEESTQDESFSSDGLLEYPQYTRPREFEGMTVPDVLLSGHHAEILKWRRKQSLMMTARHRPDLLKKAKITDIEYKMLSDLQRDMEKPHDDT